MLYTSQKLILKMTFSDKELSHSKRRLRIEDDRSSELGGGIPTPNSVEQKPECSSTLWGVNVVLY